ncbi:MAG TPA: sugar ABC transporter substrate-binding protein [Candidatus Limnocylindrales bacterium]|nr:sugar ABC transporter substrate-binding protein [Candidatus Limnocylindrales bacterium]
MDDNVIFDNSDPNNPQKRSNPPQGVESDAAVSSASTSSDYQPISSMPLESEGGVSALPVSEGTTDVQSGEVDAVVEETEQSVPLPPRGGIIKKLIIGLIILLVLIFIFFLIIPKGKSNKKVKLVWWGLWEDARVMQPLISEFQKENPNITIEYTKQNPKQYREKLLARINNGTGPDVFRFHNSWVSMMSDSLLPLPTDVITPNELKTDFYPVIQKDMTKNGAIYGIPLGVDTLGLFINTELLKSAGVAPPQTWDAFVKAASSMTVKDPETKKILTAGAALGTYGNITHVSDLLSLLFIQQGIDMSKFPSANVGKKVAVLNFYRSFSEGDSSVWDNTLDESILSFSSGNLAMYIGFSWDIFRIKALNPELDFKTYPVPQLVGRKSTLASYWSEGISSNSKNQDAALLFIKYLKKKETAQKFYAEVAKTREFGEPYARSELAKTLKDNEMIFPFVSQLQNASSSYFASDTNDGEGGINSISNNYLGNAINAMINDNSSAETVVEALNQGISQAYEKYGVQ